MMAHADLDHPCLPDRRQLNAPGAPDCSARSGWTQDELAKAEGQSRIWITCHVRFGRFLDFVTTVTNADSPTAALTERRFRDYWKLTDSNDPNERSRFSAGKPASARSARRPRLPMRGRLAQRARTRRSGMAQIPEA
jgi:hypothetical protein